MYNWIEADEELQNAIDEIREELLDFVESKFFNLIRKGDKGAMIFFLKTIGKHRGYVEKYDFQGNIKLDELPYNGGIFHAPRKYDA